MGGDSHGPGAALPRRDGGAAAVAIRPAPRRRDGDSASLLTSFARCGWCGESLVTASRRRTGKERDFFYGCLTHWKKCGSRCRNNLAARMTQTDAEVLGAVETDIFRPVLRTLLVGQITLTPVIEEARGGYTFEGAILLLTAA